jgi:hypothetical protein
MGARNKVGFATKFLSNRNYLKEVSVEGKTTPKFHFNLTLYDHYAAQIIRSGNCITLLSNSISITKDNFWNTNYFEDLTKYVFWTFNKSFRLTLIDNIELLNFSTITRCQHLLEGNFEPYDTKLEQQTDEEVQWCLVKNEHIKKDDKFKQMYLLDKENRTEILKALTEKVASLKTVQNIAKPVEEEITAIEAKAKSFLDLLKPINNDTLQTLQFIQQKLEVASFEFNLFNKIDKLPNGKNPYGLNGTIAAMIDFFYQYDYFKKEHNLEEIFKAYSSYTGNSIAKLKTFLSEFRQDNSYVKHVEKLKKLKISKLK